MKVYEVERMARSNHTNGSSNLEIAQSNQELIMEKQVGRRKKALAVGIVVVGVVVALIIAAIVLSSPTGKASPLVKRGSSIQLEEVLYGGLSPKPFNGTWISDHQILYRSASGDIVLYDANKLESKILLPANNPVLATAIDYTLSPDQKYLLIGHDFQKLFRHSYVAQYTLFNLQDLTSSVLKTLEGEFVLQLAIWAPVGNGIAFVAKNDIFYRPSASVSNVFQITKDGQIGNVYNGVPDWVYEEEVLSSNTALWFSPDGAKLAYAKFKDTNVPTMTLPVYGQPGSLEFQYTKAVQIRYPKAGAPNPYASLHVAQLTPLIENNLEPPSNLLDKFPVLSAVSWATNETLGAIWMSRVQNEASIMAYTVNGTAYTAQLVKKLEQKGGWLELFTPPIISKDGSRFLIILSHDQGGNAGSYRHITIFDRQENATGQPLTHGKFVVTEILKWNEANQLVYYLANNETDPGVQHLYSISTKTKDSKCISCDIKNVQSNSECTYNTAAFSTDGGYFIFNCDGPRVSEVSLMMPLPSGVERLLIWENNKELLDTVNSRVFPKTKRFTFDVADGFKAQVMLQLPPDMDTSGNTKYPMLVHVYGGPDSYQVVERFAVDWGSYLAANKSIIYAIIDGRGSGLKGDKLLFSIYRRMGTVEIADQLNVTRQIQATLPYVDPTRTAIWGWSYGGYASGMALATDTEGIFKCGMSVAPVTDWTLYDSIYTERFMGLPTVNDNLQGYQNAQLLTKYEGIRDKKYFLVHGTLDDNVHYQQSMFWAKVLEQKDILFRQLSYPDEDHGLLSVRPHLYHSLEDFLDECFVEISTKDVK